jgi:gluconokinase
MNRIATSVVVIMGVSSSGKTTIAKALAGKLGWHFEDGDDLHPRENVEKMKSGTSLSDADRWPWLERIAARIDGWRARSEAGVVTCSALKRVYRDVIVGDRPDVALVYLKGSPDLIRARMAARKGHFMPLGLLDNQFTVLQEPAADERPVVVDIAASPDQIVAEIVRQLEAR